MIVPGPARPGPDCSAGSEAIAYFHNQCPSNIEGLRDGENESEWIVDLTTQVLLPAVAAVSFL